MYTLFLKPKTYNRLLLSHYKNTLYQLPQNYYKFFFQFQVFSDKPESPGSKVEIKFLRYTNGRFWDFLESEDIKIIDVQFVILGPVVPASTIKKGYTFQKTTLP